MDRKVIWDAGGYMANIVSQVQAIISLPLGQETMVKAIMPRDYTPLLAFGSGLHYMKL